MLLISSLRFAAYLCIFGVSYAPDIIYAEDIEIRREREMISKQENTDRNSLVFPRALSNRKDSVNTLDIKQLCAAIRPLDFKLIDLHRAAESKVEGQIVL